MKKEIKRLVCTALSICMVMTGALPALAREPEVHNMDEESQKLEANKPLFEDVTHLSEEEENELYQKYEEFMAISEGGTAICYNSVTQNIASKQKLDAFADYAVETNLISNNQAQKNGVKVAVVRASLKTVASAGKACGYKIAALCLDHSLQDSPSALYYTSSDMQAKQVMKTKEFKSIIKQFKNEVKSLKKNVRNHSMSGTVPFESNTDLYLAFHNMRYRLDGVKQGGRWAVTVKFTDTYDFEYWEWSKKLVSKHNAVVAINNYGAMAQEIKAIVPYNITINVKYNVPIK